MTSSKRTSKGSPAMGPPPPCKLKILAIDPASQTGWCLREKDGTKRSTSVPLIRKGQSSWMRPMAMRNLVAQIIRDIGKFDLLVYERVKGLQQHNSAAAAHLHGALIYAIQEQCFLSSTATMELFVSEIKKFATGNGNAKKEMMIAAAKNYWPGQKITDDNEADACWIAEFAAHKINKGLV